MTDSPHQGAQIPVGNQVRCATRKAAHCEMVRSLPSTYRRRLYGAVGSGALLATATTYVGLVDPHNPHSLFPLCPFKLLTGWNCPACGGLRMVHDVLHGDLLAAVTDNVFLMVGLPMLAVWILLRRRHRDRVLPIPAVATIAAAAITWTVLRNLPSFPLIPTVTGG